MPTAVIDLNLPAQPIGASETIPDSFRHDNRLFTRQQLAIAGAALDAGVFYQTAFAECCLNAWNAAHPHASQLCLTVDAEGQPSWTEHTRERREAMESELKSAPRGTWALLGRSYRNSSGNGITYAAFIADGMGDVHEPHTSDLLGEPPYQTLYDRMVTMEIYLARRAEERRRSLLASHQRIAGFCWTTGTVLRDVCIGGTTYSTAVLTVDAPYVSAFLTKRGSKKRFQWRGLAQALRIPDYESDTPGLRCSLLGDDAPPSDSQAVVS